ncbi:hypothetical protein [Glaciibacter flavus]|uniref:hypothetical protein n=1 Tax=Orlajensenia flava TaxID=2565934 RepID=UPI003AFF952E
MTLQSKDDRRASLNRKIMKAIATGSVRVAMPYRSPDGTFPVVVALPNDNMSDVAARVIATGGPVNLVIASANSFRVIQMGKIPADEIDNGEPTDEINQELSLGMFLIALDRHAKRDARFSFRSVGASALNAGRKFAYL